MLRFELCNFIIAHASLIYKAIKGSILSRRINIQSFKHKICPGLYWQHLTPEQTTGLVLHLKKQGSCFFLSLSRHHLSWQNVHFYWSEFRFLSFNLCRSRYNLHFLQRLRHCCSSFIRHFVSHSRKKTSPYLRTDVRLVILHAFIPISFNSILIFIIIHFNLHDGGTIIAVLFDVWQKS